MITASRSGAKRGTYLSPRSLLAAGLLIGGLSIALALAEALATDLRHALQWVTPVRALVLVAAGAFALAVPLTRRPLADAAVAVARLPPAFALALLVAAAGAFQAIRGANATVPIVLGDELVYVDLAKSVAVDGELLLRGTAHLGHSILYPLATAPYLALAGDTASGMFAAKAGQALLIALAVVPAYLIARRALPHGWSLGVAALTAVAPWSGYAALVMTEALFYPLFLAFALVLVLMLERPTLARQAGAVGLALALALVRPQALALLPAIATAAAVLVLPRGGVRSLRRFAPALTAVAVLSLAGVAALAVGSSAPGGAYGAIFDDAPSVLSVAKWAVFNVADWALAVGVVALAALPLALARLLRHDCPARERALGAATAALVTWVLLSVAVLSATPYGLDRLHERNLFFLTPLVLACFAHWLQSGLPRPRAVLAACVAAGAGALIALPPRLIELGNEVDSPAVIPIKALIAAYPSVPARAWTICAGLAGVLVLVAARSALVPLASVAFAFLALAPALTWESPLAADETRRLSWVDPAIPGDARATLLHVDFAVDPSEACHEAAENEQQALALWTEFFNAKVGPVLHLYGDNGRTGLASPELTVGDGGVLLDGRGHTLAPAYVVVDTRQPLAGVPLRRFDLADAKTAGWTEGSSLTLWRVDPPLRIGPVPFPAPPRPNAEPC